ncbi:2,3-bisphosphoglycerate-independent phosphoglycerate mutase [Candidatus Peregrinibacteria bacterium]|nr:2,3-bisphosphoglycerate-independent phosphoglycerate mutase [Candidatus Peregrinibacteria bacterium]
MKKKKAILIILDGFGEGEKDRKKNAVYAAKTPFLDSLKEKHPWSLLEPGGESVGVLPGQTGGSDVGHNTIGAGRVIRQPVKIIYDAVEDRSFFSNKELIQSINHAKENNSNLHLFGIGSDSYIHSYTQYIYALLDLIKQEGFPGERVFLHLAADGRDTPPQSATDFFKKIELECKKRKIGKIASVIGRFYLDRGKAWNRTRKIYQLLTDVHQKYKENWNEYLEASYAKGETDQFIHAMAFGDENGIFPRVSDNDALINFCYRADRERQITEALSEKDFSGFCRKKVLENFYYMGFIQYSPDFKNAHHAFEEEQADICLSEVISNAGLKQMHIAGKEKIIFVTYNLNRCEEIPIEGENDVTAPQTKEVENFDENPEMSTPNLTNIFLDALGKNKNDVYIANYENSDQVGHTGNFSATVKAIESIDTSLSQIIPKALEKGFEIIITADHGNADVMVDDDGNPHTAHSHNKVPCVFVSDKRVIKLRDGELSDVAPTLLHILDIPKPKLMTGQVLIRP